MDLRKRRLIFGGIFFALMFFYHGTTLFFQFVQVGSYVGWRGKSDDGKHFYTTTPDLTSPTAMVQRGDELVAVNGIHPAEDFRVLELADRSPVGTPFTMTFSRNGQLFSIVGQTVPFPPGKYPYASKERLTLTLIWLVFLVTGLALILLKPENRQAWLLALMLGSFTGIIRDTYPYSYFGFALEVIVSLGKISAIWFFPLFALFFLNFPERSRLLLRLPRLERWIYWSNYVLLLPLWLGNSLPSAWRAAYINLPLLRVLFGWEPKFKLSISAYAIYLAAGFFFIAFNYWHANQDARRRMRVAILGSSPGFIALLLFVLNNFEFVRVLPHWATVIEWVQWLLYYVLPLIPLSFAYAIIRHKVIPISLIIRRGVRYLLVSRGSILLLIASVAVLTWLMMDAIFRYFHVSDGRVVGTLSAMVAVVSWQFVHNLHNRVIAPAIDRRFFRQAYDSQKLMSELADSLRTTTEVPRLLELVATKLQAALQTESVTILLKDRQSGEFKSAYACEYDAQSGGAVNCQRPSELPANSHSLEALAKSDEPLELDWPAQSDAKPVWLNNGSLSASFLKSELQVLQTLRPALLLPLKVKDELSGAVLLGARLGDLPFSSEDKRLVQSVVAPTSLALQNASLIEQRIEDARRREELEAENEARARELEEARQLQLSMLPKQVPQLPHLEIAAYMKTATEVGGDYYDFHLSSDGTLTVAIGDATGHGLKAGTVVTAMKSLFYALALEPSLAEILSHSSRVLKSMNLRSLFMALTLAKLKGNILRIASAGMPPALLYRRETNEVEEILMKTMPLGSLRDYPYREQSIVLQSGDALVLMSDGFPERFNAAGEILGFDKGAAILQLAHSLTATQIVETFIQAEDQWAQGFAQNDDVTFVVLKVK